MAEAQAPVLAPLVTPELGGIGDRLRSLLSSGIPLFVAGELPDGVRRSIVRAGLAPEPWEKLGEAGSAGRGEFLVLTMVGGVRPPDPRLGSRLVSGGALLVVSLGELPDGETGSDWPELWEIASFRCGVDSASGELVRLHAFAHRQSTHQGLLVRILALAQREREHEQARSMAELEAALASLVGRLETLERKNAALASALGDEAQARESAVAVMRGTVLDLFASLATASDERLAEMRRVASELATLRKNLEPALSLAAAARRLFSPRVES